jgi:hypothetical protein
LNLRGDPYITCRECRALRRARYSARDDVEEVVRRIVTPGDFEGWIPRSGMESVDEHYLGGMDRQCTHCGALHWLDEKLKVYSITLYSTRAMLTNQSFIE